MDMRHNAKLDFVQNAPIPPLQIYLIHPWRHDVRSCKRLNWEPSLAQGLGWPGQRRAATPLRARGRWLCQRAVKKQDTSHAKTIMHNATLDLVRNAPTPHWQVHWKVGVQHRAKLDFVRNSMAY